MTTMMGLRLAFIPALALISHYAIPSLLASLHHCILLSPWLLIVSWRFFEFHSHPVKDRRAGHLFI